MNTISPANISRNLRRPEALSSKPSGSKLILTPICPRASNRSVQSWDTANKPTEIADYSVCTTWGIKDKRLYLLHVMRRKVNYPDLKRQVRQQADMHRATIVLIEDRASGTQLIQELSNDGLRIVKAVKPEGDKVMRFNAQTATIENGFVYLPSAAPWLAELVQGISAFPAAKTMIRRTQLRRRSAGSTASRPSPASLASIVASAR